ncbi:MAG TPA: hypothetical protein VMX57_09295, partial [Planctomycetota bacterium]|nr:hypothetical protein [Planctomycetota bacterium]
MMRRGTFIATVMLALAIPAAAPAAPLLRDAAVRKTPDGCEIAFTLAEPTDVTVRIVDAKGEVLRHLVCGMVGLERAAVPFAPKTLQQKIVWDGKDDAGKPATGPYSVEIGVGLRAKFEKFLLDGHDTFFSEICAFGGSNETGHVFTANLGAMIHRICFVREFDREGNYVRTVWPLNPNMDEKLYLEFVQRSDTSAWKRYDMHWKWGTKDYNGKWVLGELHDNNFGGLAASSLTQAADGRIIGMRRIASPRAFIVWAADGRVLSQCQVVAPWYKFGDPLRPHAYNTLNICSGPDGKLLYVTDVGQTAKGGEMRWGWVVGCFDAATLKPVNRFTWSGLKKLDQPVYHLGTPNEPGEDEAHFKGPTGVAIDDRGRFWVGDVDCVKVYDGDGRFLKRIDAKTPGFEKVQFSSIKLGANHRHGGVFVASGGAGRGPTRKLVKIDSFEDLRVVWELPLVNVLSRYTARQVFVDSDADLVWVAEGAGKRTLLRVLDKGATFEKRVIDGNVPGKLQKPQWMRADADGNVYVLDMGRKAVIRTDIDGKTFKEIPVQVSSSDGYFCLDAEGNLYITESQRKGFRLRKFSPDGKPLKVGDRDALEFTGPDDWIRNEKVGRVKGVC